MIRLLHRVSLFRTFAKIISKNIILSQKFHGGKIYFNAVDHSWAWTNTMRFQTFDQYLQQKITHLSLQHEQLIDIGCNVGGIGLAVMLKNKNINTIFIDPNVNALKCLNKSISYNKLNKRCRVINAVANCSDEPVNFDSKGSVIGHVTKNGKEKVYSINIWKLLNGFDISKKILVKIDIEGFETKLLGNDAVTPNSDNIIFLIELHPKGFNNLGDPEFCLAKLKELGYRSFDLEGAEIKKIDPNQISQIIFKK